MQRFLNNITRTVQGILYVCGISIHNNYTGECVPDFSCCHRNTHTPIRKRIKFFIGDMRRCWR